MHGTVPRSSPVETTVDAIRAHVAQRLRKVGDCIPKEAELVEHLIAAASHNAALQALYAYFDESIHCDLRIAFADTVVPEPTLAAHHDLVATNVAQDEQAAVDAAGSLLEPLIEALAVRESRR